MHEETFDRVQQRLADNKRFASRNSKVPSLLQGLAACSSCGYGYYRTMRQDGAVSPLRGLAGLADSAICLQRRAERQAGSHHAASFPRGATAAPQAIPRA
jgi:hypothetical protein